MNTLYKWFKEMRTTCLIFYSRTGVAGIKLFILLWVGNMGMASVLETFCFVMSVVVTTQLNLKLSWEWQSYWLDPTETFKCKYKSFKLTKINKLNMSFTLISHSLFHFLPTAIKKILFPKSSPFKHKFNWKWISVPTTFIIRHSLEEVKRAMFPKWWKLKFLNSL